MRLRPCDLAKTGVEGGEFCKHEPPHLSCLDLTTKVGLRYTVDRNVADRVDLLQLPPRAGD